MTIHTANELEIAAIPPLSPGELSLLDMHSVVNVLNVLRNELAVLGLRVIDDENLFAAGIAIADTLLAALRDHDAALQAARHTDDFEAAVLADLDDKLPPAVARTMQAEVGEAIANIRTVFAILRVRARELLARAAEPERWEEFSCERIAGDLRRVFAAIERNSRGRYRILFNAALQEPTDYYVDLRVEGPGGIVSMPPVFLDVMRDLIANARKYTEPGGHITAALYEDAESLRFVVADDGRGIPAAEIQRVVEFGQRGSNVGDVRTMGGGFGLTKAFLVARQFGGRFWIGSEVGQGTRVRLRIPRPGA